MLVHLPFTYIFHHVLLHVPILAYHYCPLQWISLLFSSLHMPIFCISFSFLFFDHLPHIPVPMFALSFAFSFPFTAVNRHSILPLQEAVSLGSFLAWSCHLQSHTGCLWAGLFASSNMRCREPALSVNTYTHMQRLFWAPFSSCFTSSASSSLVMLSTVLPLWTSFTILLLRSFSCLFIQTIYIFCHCVHLSSTLTLFCVSGSIALLFTPVLTSPRARFCHLRIYSCNQFDDFFHVVLHVWYLKSLQITESQNRLGWKRPPRSSSPTSVLTLTSPTLNHITKGYI